MTIAVCKWRMHIFFYINHQGVNRRRGKKDDRKKKKKREGCSS